MIFSNLLPNRLHHAEKMRIKALKSKLLPDELRRFYERPLPSPDAFIDECRLTSIDFETTGLDFEKDCVISEGGIGIVNGKIDFATAFHYYLKVNAKINKDAVIVNQILPEQLLNGKDPKLAMLELMDRISGGVVLTHCCVIESTFLKKSLGLDKRLELPMIFLDTMAIERSLFASLGNVEDLRLAAIRKRRKLPSYEAHNALADSIATAEVFLAQEKEIFAKKRPTLYEMFSRSH